MCKRGLSRLLGRHSHRAALSSAYSTGKCAYFPAVQVVKSRPGLIGSTHRVPATLANAGFSALCKCCHSSLPDCHRRHSPHSDSRSPTDSAIAAALANFCGSMPVMTTLPLCRALGSASCTLAGCRPACATASRSRSGAAHLRATPGEPLAWGEEAPGTGAHHRITLLACLAPSFRSTTPCTCGISLSGSFCPRWSCKGAGRTSAGIAAGLRHFPEQAVDTPPEEDPQRQGNFEMRSTAEVYELFERLQHQQLSGGQRSGGSSDGAVDFREAAAGGGPALEQPEEALRAGPLTGISSCLL